MSNLKPSRLYAVEDLFRVNNGEWIRTAGMLKKEENGKVFMLGIHDGRVEVNLTENLIEIHPGANYLVIGEYNELCVYARIIREISFKKYSLAYYLGKMPDFLKVDNENLDL